MKKIPIIMDVDTGIDDAVAIMYAMRSEEIDIKGITVVAGNQVLSKTLQNTLNVVEYFGHPEIPVVMGAAAPLIKEQVIAPEVHGDSGLGRTVLPKASKKPELDDAITFLRKTIEESEDKITLVPVGPLTNIALLFLSYPHVKEKIEKIVMMGGGAFTGNQTAAAEFNIWVDPEAAAVVFNSGVPIVMCGLDVTLKSYVDRFDLDKFKAVGTKAGDFCYELFDFYLDTFGRKYNKDICAIHDAVTIFYLLHPEYVTTKKATVKVDIDGKYTYGCTATDFRPYRPADPNDPLVCMDIDRSKFVHELLKACESYK